MKDLTLTLITWTTIAVGYGYKALLLGVIIWYVTGWTPFDCHPCVP